jgi:uncharacterized Zn finger protein (UPF0148 family)
MAGEATCGQCGAPLKPGARFCASCGAPVAAAAPAAPASDPAWEKLKARLEKAMAEAKAALDEAAAGHLDDEGLRKKLFAAGLVVHDDRALMLDLENGRWAAYDGLEVRFQPFETA